MAFKYRIGIDPDIKYSGYAQWDSSNKKFIYIDALCFFDIIDLLKGISKFQYSTNIFETQIHIEASWLINTTQWKYKGKTQAISDLIAKKVGQNRQIGLLFEEFCKREHVPYILHKPVTSKIKSIKTFRALTKWEGRVNQDSIDAAMMVLGA